MKQSKRERYRGGRATKEVGTGGRGIAGDMTLSYSTHRHARERHTRQRHRYKREAYQRMVEQAQHP